MWFCGSECCYVLRLLLLFNIFIFVVYVVMVYSIVYWYLM